MSNGIAARQNSPGALELQYAKSALYDSARRWARAQLLPAIAALAALGFLQVWPTVWGPYATMVASFLSLVAAVWLRTRERAQREQAALMQEEFDCFVLAMPWQPIAAGKRPVEDDKWSWAQRYRGNKAKLSDWYPAAADALPITEGRVLCQRVNGRWDAQMRRRFAVLLAVAGTCVVVALVALGLARD